MLSCKIFRNRMLKLKSSFEASGSTNDLLKNIDLQVQAYSKRIG